MEEAIRETDHIGLCDFKHDSQKAYKITPTPFFNESNCYLYRYFKNTGAQVEPFQYDCRKYLNARKWIFSTMIYFHFHQSFMKKYERNSSLGFFFFFPILYSKME